MIFTVYETAQHFKDDVIEVLNRHELQNNILYKNIGDSPEILMVSVKDDDGNVLLTVNRTASLPMLMYETDNKRNDDAVKFLAKSFIEHEIPADFIMTEKALAKRFCDYYSDLTGKIFHKNESLVLYLLDKVNDIAPINGSFRKADKSDMYFLPYWYADFQPACKIGEYNLDSGIRSSERAVEKGTAYLWVDGHPVSLASNVRNQSNCAFIGQVYTPPNYRGKGYSAACVSHLSQKLLDEGFQYCALYADCANPYSNKVYQKVGYKEIFWYDQYKLTP